MPCIQSAIKCPERSLSVEAKDRAISYLRSKCHLLPPSDILREALFSGCLTELLEGETAYLAEYHSLWVEGDKLIVVDDKDRFASFLRSNKEKVEKLPPFAFLESICFMCSEGCAEALFESGFHVDLNVAFDMGMFPLQFVAKQISSALTELFLQHGAEPEAKANALSKLPLTIALGTLCWDTLVFEWRKEMSIFKLFYLLCLPESKELLDTVRLLASGTKQVERVCARIIEDGAVVKLTALLIAAKDKLLVPSAGGGLETTAVARYLSCELRREAKEEIQFIIGSESPSSLPSKPLMCTRKEKLVNALKVVKTLWGAIDVLEEYRHSLRVKSVAKHEVPFDIAYRLVKDTTLVLTPEDVYCEEIICLRPKLTSEAKALARRICSVSSSRHSVRKPAMGASWFPPSSSCSQRHAFHTCRPVNFNTKPVEIPLSEATQMKPSLHNFIASARKPATGTFWFLSSPSMSSSPYRAFYTCQAVNFNIVKPLKYHLSKAIPMKPSLRNVIASAPLIRIAKWIAK